MPQIPVGRDHSFRWHLTALIAVLTVPLLTLTIIPTVTYIASERGYLQSRVRESNADILSALDRDLSAKIGVLQALAASPALDTSNFDRFDRQSRELFAGAVDIGLRPLDRTQFTDPAFPVGTGPPKVGMPIDHEVWATRRPVVSGVFIGPATDQFEVTVAVPVVRDGAMLYVLAARMTSSYFIDLLVSQKLKPPYFAVIADHDGLIIAATRPSVVLSGTSLTGYADMPGPEGAWSGVTKDQVAVFSTYRRSSLSGWIVSTSIEQAALNAPLYRSLWQLFATFLGLTAVMLAGGMYISRRMTTAFGALTRASEDMGSGTIAVFPRTWLREANTIGNMLGEASRKTLEASSALRRVNEDLEQRVGERTREADLARARAEAANHAKSQFLASISHELRTPLNAISGFAQLLVCSEEKLRHGRQIRYARNIMDGSEQLKSIIDDVLDMAAIDVGRVNLTCEAIDCLEVMSVAFRSMEGLAK